MRDQLEAARAELLDLTLRNPLLNYRHLQARGLEFKHEAPDELFEHLVVREKGVGFLAKQEEADPNVLRAAITEPARPEPFAPPPWSYEHGAFIVEFLARVDAVRVGLPAEAGAAPEEPEVPRIHLVVVPLAALYEAPEPLKPGQVRTGYTAAKLESRMTASYRAARTLLQEQGVNSLLLTLGFLEWFEDANSHTLKRAPLLLVPVSLERANVSERFHLTYTGDEVLGNHSLGGKLKDFGVELPPVPETEGLEPGAYLDLVEAAIRSQPRWRVERHTLAVAFFSFSKHLMYADLDASKWEGSGALTEHPVLVSLLDKGFREPASELDDTTQLDARFRPQDVRQVVDADSSQIMAMADALAGRNLIIQGPPGTGKSQTITNLIAEAIGQGKRVLFVAEKMAALEVVKRRLDAVGLGDACLELHSHKTNKKELLHEVKRTLDLGSPQVADETPKLEQLERLRGELNTHADLVNRPVEASGYSFQRLVGELALLAPQAPEGGFVPIGLPGGETWTRAQFEEHLYALAKLEAWCRDHGTPAHHLFWGGQLRAILPSSERALSQALADAAEATTRLETILSELAPALGMPTPQDARGVSGLAQALGLALDAPEFGGVPFDAPEWRTGTQSVRDLVASKVERAELTARHRDVLTAKAWDADVEETRRDLDLYGRAWWRVLSGRYRRARDAAARLYASRPPKGVDEQLALLDVIVAAQASAKRYEALEPLGPTYFGARWLGGELSSDAWAELARLTDWLAGVYDRVHAGELPEYTVPLLKERARVLALRERVEAFRAAVMARQEAAERVRALLEFADVQRFGEGGLPGLSLPEQRDLFENWRQGLGELPEIIVLNHVLAGLAAPELAPLVGLGVSEAGAGVRLVATLKNAWFELLAETALRAWPHLNQFSGESHDATIRAFRELDLLSLDFNRKRLILQHHQGLPAASDHGQMRVLSREFQKKSRHLPIRQLMLRAGNAVQSIKPVFMMSPLSIAQFVPPQSLSFDLVVFDEASQVRPAEALGAIVRGDQTVVVGDSRQLPPTSFFSVFAQADEEEETATSDIESVLGLFAAQGAPERMLRWHYRSRHESLIAVSNKEFYDNRLLVFPSPDASREATGLVFRHLPHTVYDRGGSSANVAEARAVAKAVIQHAKTQPGLTLGVAAFSSKQMMAIEDMVEAERRQDPSCEGFFAAHPHEPFFVKNLETVQGDERDVIFISLGYGRDASGKVSMNFGPLNRDGGQRRLNVLITRARRRCEVFSNITADDLDTRQTAAWGVRALKTFLHYAQHGELSAAEETGRDFDSPFEEAVHRALTNRGVELRKQVGSAGYFVDLAVVDPAKPGRYLLGIECDGARYHSSQSARDRDRLRQGVLEGLGWRLHRIWSTDWFRNPEREVQKVLEAVRRAKLSDPDFVTSGGSAEARTEVERRDALPTSNGIQNVFYETARLSLGAEVGPDLHLVPAQRLSDWIVTVVEAESPVHLDEVARRICDAVGIKRRGARIAAALTAASRVAERRGQVVVDGHFLRLPQGREYTPRDRSRLPVASRKIELVAPQELEAAVLEAVKVSLGLPRDEIPGVAARYLGFNRASGTISEAFQGVIDRMIQDERLARHGADLVAA